MARSKYGNQINQYDGHIFDSLKERQRYQELKLLERAGEIRDLRVHPVYILLLPFEYRGKVERSIHYEGDFQYITNDGNHVIIEDVKGMKTAVYKLKRKLLLYKCKEGMEITIGDQRVMCHPEFLEI